MKTQIYEREGVPCAAQVLSLGGAVCSNSLFLSSFGAVDNAVFNLSLPVVGGGKKRKKKVYTTPKKIKHKNAKVPLKSLKYYKVDENGKITRLRKMSPSAPGCFLAQHFDRLTCGKTGLTYFLKDEEQNE